MKIRYYPDTHSLTIQLVNRPGVEAEEVTPGLVVDFDAEGRPVSIEFEDASGLDVSEIEISGVPLTKVLSGLEVVASVGGSKRD